MKRAAPLLIALGVATLLAIGLMLWRDQGALIWLSGFTPYCF